MGAGASRGRRKTDNAQYKMEKDESNIIEGLPLVNEIPQRLEYHIQSFAKYAVPATLKNTIFVPYFFQITQKLSAFFWVSKYICSIFY